MADDWKTLRVPKDAYDKAKEQKEEHNRTWGEQIIRDGDNDTTTEVVETAEVVEELKNEISMAADPTMEVDTEGIINRIDDLETRLPNKVAEELR